jgi:hypothetical protein
MLGFYSSRPNWDSHAPSAADDCATPPPPLGFGGWGTHSFERKGVEGLNSDEGTDTVVLYIYIVTESKHSHGLSCAGNKRES